MSPQRISNVLLTSRSFQHLASCLRLGCQSTQLSAGCTSWDGNGQGWREVFIWIDTRGRMWRSIETKFSSLRWSHLRGWSTGSPRTWNSNVLNQSWSLMRNGSLWSFKTKACFTQTSINRIYSAHLSDCPSRHWHDMCGKASATSTNPPEEGMWLHHPHLWFCQGRKQPPYHLQWGGGHYQGHMNYYLSRDGWWSMVGSHPIACSDRQGHFHFQGGPSGVCCALCLWHVFCTCIAQARCSLRVQHK